VLFAPNPVKPGRLDTTREGMFSTGTRHFVGQNPPRQVNIDFVLGQKAEGLVSLSVAELDGKVVREFDLAKEANAGFHRVVWDLAGGIGKKDGGKGGKAGAAKGGGKGGGGKAGGAKGGGGGPAPKQAALQGTFRVHLNVNGQLLSRTIVVEADPLSRTLAADDDEAEEDRLLRREFDRLQPLLVP
jgi:hypothetical protein